MTPDEKKRIKKEIRDRERTQFIESMPFRANELRKVLKQLDRELSKAGCDHTLKKTLYIIRILSIDEDTAVIWLHDHGGYCDCEVLANIEGRFEDAMKVIK
ncbi:DUF2695 domain-containing protein [Ponticaulis sp.]|uniref:DUF2695 domain-containing protein n=1 Tax=Ponticaulis sp. TaxID=2020902 RepID=UPI002637D12B|nr:DUF2695 domain-containing protein [Ponticaulis sp.]MDF1682202.1 DUF2695 domain-containing protein [Ponticaulis sp.]